ncbi:ISL3 family transposase ISFsp1 [Streptomyces sp. RB5]|uniref:ISL3 family transposase ISFsp1 n=1 Tax=Streptomyces smaragdinus TaxID=2585196 RepID=A0A7K0CTW6_9ACTN|nr:ISL3 family transposase [Streptomyces smaragdinus]MQY16878.1 ISL3 family transposase ISFsp1 [Streptomyces smaragdinus]
MDHNEISWQDVLFEGFEVLVTAAVHTACGLAVRLRGRSETGSCPACGRASRRVHDRYERRLQDLPLAGRAVRIVLAVRRFVCVDAACVQRTFAEQIPDLTSPYARSTDRLGALLDQVALALAGRAGARMATVLGLTAGRMGLLNRIRRMPDPVSATPQVLGVDDFATRRGHTYATVLTDSETHRVIDVLPGRDAAPLAQWLTVHPGIEVICRDRAGAYADGARDGAPDARQVADRFHLWQNLGQAVEKCVVAHRACLAAPQAAGNAAAPPRPGPSEVSAHGNGLLAARLRAHHALVHGLLDDGMGIRAIARHLGWGRHTVQRYARADTWQQVSTGRHHRGSSLDAHHTYLARRITETDGRVTLTDLHRELAGQGWTGAYSTLRDWAVRRLDHHSRRPPRPAPALRPPSVRQVTGWLTRRPSTLTEDEHQLLKTVLDTCPELTTAHRLIRDFGDMVTQQTGVLLPAWIKDATGADLPGLSGFARGLLGDLDAVTAGLTLHWSSGGTEGAVNRIKKIKRQLYGRAEFELLRKLILLQ